MKKWYFIIFLLACVPTWVSIALGIGTPFDEMAHFDYADKLAHLEIPKVNEQYGQRTLRIIACQEDDPGVAWAGIRDCDAAVINASAAPFNGQSSATSYSPTYYAIVAAQYRFCDSSFGNLFHLAPLTCMRIANSLFAGTSALLLLGIGTLLGFSVFSTSIAALISVNSPSLIQQMATVNTDAGALFAIIFSVFLSLWIPLRAKRKLNSTYSVNNELVVKMKNNWADLRYVISIGVIMTFKETAILIAPMCCWLFVSMRENILSSEISGSNQKDRTTQLHILRKSILLLIMVISIAGAIRWMQPLIRGVGGEDWMSMALRGNGELTVAQIVLPVQHLLSSSSQLVWPRLTDPIGYNLASILSALFIGSLILRYFTHPRLSEVNLPTRNTFTFSLQIGILTLIPASIMLGILSWLTAGFVISQPRYYLPTVTFYSSVVLIFLLSTCSRMINLSLLTVFSLLMFASFLLV